jgi:putative transcriptional regulator
VEEGLESTRVHCRLDELLAARGITLTKLSDVTGITLANLSILKTDKARAIRFSTLVAVCDALECQPGDLFTVIEDAR